MGSKKFSPLCRFIHYNSALIFFCAQLSKDSNDRWQNRAREHYSASRVSLLLYNADDDLICFLSLLQVDPHRDRLGGVLVREAGPAGDIPQSGKDGRLDIALSELSVVIFLSFIDDDCAKREREREMMYTTVRLFSVAIKRIVARTPRTIDRLTR